MNQQIHTLLSELLPWFANELAQLLREVDEPELASQVPTLAIHDRCRCGDDIFRAALLQSA